jgi:hypothetical protein
MISRCTDERVQIGRAMAYVNVTSSVSRELAGFEFARTCDRGIATQRREVYTTGERCCVFLPRFVVGQRVR